MSGTSKRDSGAAWVERLTSAARRQGAPEATVRDACDATSRRIGPLEVLEPSRRARAEAYFWGVVRRRALSGDAPAVRERLMVTSLAGELAYAGHTPARVFEELVRVYGPFVDARLIEQFRPRSEAA
jgi:hypothetical protein